MSGDGIYQKFKIKRSDGSHRKGRKHEHCTYFVLDLEHDKYAPAALRAYAKACQKENPALARDLRKIAAARRRNYGRFFHGPETPNEMAAMLMDRAKP